MKLKIFTKTNKKAKKAAVLFYRFNSFAFVAPTGNKQKGPNFSTIFFDILPKSERYIFLKALIERRDLVKVAESLLHKIFFFSGFR